MIESNYDEKLMTQYERKSKIKKSNRVKADINVNQYQNHNC